MTQRTVNIGGIYRHFKGQMYQVDNIAKDKETGKWMVVYHRINLPIGQKPIFWVRPMYNFLSVLDKKIYPQAKQKYRFEEVES